MGKSNHRDFPLILIIRAGKAETLTCLQIHNWKAKEEKNAMQKRMIFLRLKLCLDSFRKSEKVSGINVDPKGVNRALKTNHTIQICIQILDKFAIILLFCYIDG